jgi:hypothetical protein
MLSGGWRTAGIALQRENSPSTQSDLRLASARAAEVRQSYSELEEPSVARSGEGYSAGHRELSDPDNPQVRRSLVRLAAKVQSPDLRLGGRTKSI